MIVFALRWLSLLLGYGEEGEKRGEIDRDREMKTDYQENFYRSIRGNIL